jgi:hypothetical protein
MEDMAPEFDHPKFGRLLVEEVDTIWDMESTRMVLRQTRMVIPSDTFHKGKALALAARKFLDTVAIRTRQMTMTMTNLIRRKETPIGKSRILVQEGDTLEGKEYSRMAVHRVVATNSRRKRKVSVMAGERVYGIREELVLV